MQNIKFASELEIPKRNKTGDKVKFFTLSRMTFLPHTSNTFHSKTDDATQCFTSIRMPSLIDLTLPLNRAANTTDLC